MNLRVIFFSVLVPAFLGCQNRFYSDEEMTFDKFRGTFRGLQLPKEVVNKIYRVNAVNWYKLKIE